MITSIQRIIKSGFNNFTRQFGLNFAIVFVLMLGLSLFTAVFFTDGAYNHLYDSIQGNVGISVYFNNETETDAILELKQDLEEREDVKEVIYISEEEALERFKAEYAFEENSYSESIANTLEIIDDNPLPASLRIISDQKIDVMEENIVNNYEEIAHFLEKEEYQSIISDMSYYKTEDIIRMLMNVTKKIKMVGYGIAAIFALIVVMIVFSTVRLSIRGFKEEIGIMKLVGASNWFVRGPFIVQGLICGILAAILSAILIANISYFSTPEVLKLTSGFNMFEYFTDNITQILLLQLVGGILISMISNTLAVKRYLNV